MFADNAYVLDEFMPEIRPLGADMSRYDTIILGTPVWWYTFAPAVKTFLENTALSVDNYPQYLPDGD